MKPARLFQSLTFLGTSSGVPTQHRNVQSYCLNFADGATWMFDCGEGTQHQLQKCKSVSQGKIERIFVTHLHGDHCFGLPGLMCSISLMWQGEEKKKPPVAAAASAAAVSDDEEGEVEPKEGEELVFERYSKQSEFFELVGPKDLATFLRSAFTCSDSHFSFKYRVTELWPKESPAEAVAAAKAVAHHSCEAPMRVITPNTEGTYTDIDDIDRFRGVTVKAAQLNHRIFCIGYAVTETICPGSLDMAAVQRLGIPKGPMLAELKKGKSVSFPDAVDPTQIKTVTPDLVIGKPLPGRTAVLLGDTCNSDEMLKIGTGSDWLVHESTFDDKASHLAVVRGHSTARMAAAFACRLQTKHLLLTHFSARYRPKSAEPGAEGISKLEAEARSEVRKLQAVADDVKDEDLPVQVTAVEDFLCIDLQRKK